MLISHGNTTENQQAVLPILSYLASCLVHKKSSKNNKQNECLDLKNIIFGFLMQVCLPAYTPKHSYNPRGTWTFFGNHKKQMERKQAVLFCSLNASSKGLQRQQSCRSVFSSAPMLCGNNGTDLHSTQCDARAIWALNSRQSQTYTNMLPMGKPAYYPREICLQQSWEEGNFLQVYIRRNFSF